MNAMALFAFVAIIGLTVSAGIDDAEGADGSGTTYVAQVGETQYETLQEAIEAVDGTNYTVTLLEDVIVDKTITISKDVTLAGGKSIIRDSANTGHLISVNDGFTLTIDGVTIDGAKIEAVKSSILVNDGATLKLVSGVLKDNNNTYGSGTTFGGAVLVAAGGSMEMSGGLITDNSAKVGGGVDCYGTMTITGGEIVKNTASNGPGGGICNRTNPLVAEDVVFSGNDASKNSGGALHSNPGATLTSCTITGNVASLGGGIYVQDGNKTTHNSSINLVLNDCTISGNTATGKYGGGIWCNANLELNGGIVSGNESTRQGGGIYGNGFFTINGTVTGNSSRAGGGIYVYDQAKKFGGELTIGSEAIISGNTATGSFGGAIVSWCDLEGTNPNEMASLTIEPGAVIKDNVAAGGSGGVWSNGNLTITGGTFTNNKIGDELNDLYQYYQPGDSTPNDPSTVGPTATITGGTFSSCPTIGIPDGYYAKVVAGGLYEVMQVPEDVGSTEIKNDEPITITGGTETVITTTEKVEDAEIVAELDDAELVIVADLEAGVKVTISAESVSPIDGASVGLEISTPVDIKNLTVRIIIDIPSGHVVDDAYVLWYEGSTYMGKIPATVKDGVLTFETDHNSTYYGFVSTSTVPVDDSGNDDSNLVWQYQQQQIEAQKKAEADKQSTYVAIAAGAVAALMILMVAGIRSGRL